MSSTDSISSARYSRSPGAQGANVTPQFPITTLVTPCQQLLEAIGSHDSCASRWVWISTKPGVTTFPSASISRMPRSSIVPIAVIRSPSTATSPTVPGEPVPSDDETVPNDEVVCHHGSVPCLSRRWRSLGGLVIVAVGGGQHHGHLVLESRSEIVLRRVLGRQGATSGCRSCPRQSWHALLGGTLGVCLGEPTL